MLLRRVALQNVRSFLDRQELLTDGLISIVIGPNGGGKTNLLDAVVTVLRRHLFAATFAAHEPTTEEPDRFVFRPNDALNNMRLERHRAGGELPQIIEVEVEATSRDIENMRLMKESARSLEERLRHRYVNLRIAGAAKWTLEGLSTGVRFTYRLENGHFHQSTGPAQEFLQYLNWFEEDRQLREDLGEVILPTPMLYLSVNRSANSFQSHVELASFNMWEQKRHHEAALSRSNSSVVQLAVGRLAQRYRLLLESAEGNAKEQFYSDPSLKEMSALLKELGYDWELVSIAPLRNAYNIRITKQGISFLVENASSGEKELLTYLFAIFALNVRDALVIVDEPELHLHPSWQKTLFSVFARLTEKTGNQFLLATHAPAFVSPESIQYVSRVFSHEQKSRISRLNSQELPDARHLFGIVNSQNNERIFFADKVILVEGISDRIFFEAVLQRLGRALSAGPVVEVIDVSGKGFFDSYKKLLTACQVPHELIADRDYIEQVGSNAIKSLFAVDSKEIKRDVFENVKSKDAATFVATVDAAMGSKEWSAAQDAWEYIKSRRRKLRDNLTDAEIESLHAEIDELANTGVRILKLGTLEDYLPVGHRGKSLDKLIRFLSDSEFWDALPAKAREELVQVMMGASAV